MNRIFSAKPLVAAAIALGAVVAASAAHARSDVFVSIGLNVPVRHHVEPAPVYVQPQPVYVQPQPVYRGQPRYAQRSGAWGDYDRDGVPNIRDRDTRFYDARVGHRHGGWDADRDGVPNRYDRAPGNPYRR